MAVLVDTGPTTLTYIWYDPVTGVKADVGDVTIGVVDAAGTVVVAAGTATTNTTGTYTYSLATVAEVAELTVTWTDDGGTSLQVETVDVVGGWLFTVADLRSFHKSDLTSTATYSTSDLDSVRSVITSEFEQICGVSFIPRYRRQVIRGSGGRKLELDRGRIQAVLACTVSSTVVAPSDFTVGETSYIYRTNGVFNNPSGTDPLNVTVGYRHGWSSVPPAIQRAGLIAAHARAKKDITGAGVPYNASSWSDGTGQFASFGANDRTQRWFGIPEVDSALRQYMSRTALI